MSMELDIRNPKMTADGRVDCEIDHPAYGWIPFTAAAGDVETLGRDVYTTAIQMEPLAYVAPPPAPVVVPQVVTMRQARLALLGAGLLAQVDAAIAALPSPQKEAAQIEWDYSSEVHRDRAFVQTLGVALSLTSQDLDALFTQAAQL